MSEEGNQTNKEIDIGDPETSLTENKECNDSAQNGDEPVQEVAKGSSRFGASLKAKALNAKDGIKDKVGGLKGKFTKLRHKVSFIYHV